MDALKTAVKSMIKCQNDMIINRDSGGGDFYDCEDNLINAVTGDMPGAWEILRGGSVDEFCTVVEVAPEVKAFQSDKSLTEIMRIAKRRGGEKVMESMRVGFGDLFDKFYNETTQAAYIAPAISTFGQVANG